MRGWMMKILFKKDSQCVRHYGCSRGKKSTLCYLRNLRVFVIISSLINNPCNYLLSLNGGLGKGWGFLKIHLILKCTLHHVMLIVLSCCSGFKWLLLFIHSEKVYVISPENCEGRNTVRLQITWGKCLIISLTPRENDLRSDSNDQTNIPSHR